jgi:catechol 2,3-dioxygenase-like lactoylglutathione lyase family enzyme
MNQEIKKYSGNTQAWAWHHTGISVRDIDKALEFYAKNLGFHLVFEARNMTELISSITGVDGLGAHLIQMQSPLSTHILELIQFFNVPENLNPLLPIAPGRSHTAYLVNDLDLALERLEKSGGTRLGKVTEFAEGKAVYCADQFGTVVELEELKVG